ncbi:MAG TPA: 1-deoxy-D-xylulose-5-phosphate reductoisomerase, partial [Acidimicrobiales bacterium]
MATTVSLIGSTGSIGTQTLDVVRAAPGVFDVVALGAARSIDLLAAQAHEFRPAIVALADEGLAPVLKDRLPAGTELRAGTAALESIAALADVAVNAVVGFAGLPVTLAALAGGRRLALANK